MTAPAFAAGQAVNVRPPMTPLACHRGRILRRCKNGWRGWSYALEYQDREATAAKLEGVV